MKEEQNNFKKTHPLLKKIVIILILITLLLFCYMRIWSHKTIKIREYGIVEENLSSNWNGFKIAHFSDIHFGLTTNEKELEKMVEKINLTKADIVVFTGDLFDSSINLSDKNIDDLKNNLSKIQANIKKIAIKGDSDFTNIDLYTEIMTAANFQILENENTLIYQNGTDPVLIAGISSITKENVDHKKSLENNVENIKLKILLAHEPIILDSLEEQEADIVLSGHTIGGYIKIPFMGGIIKKENTEKYLDGFYENYETKLYVTNGIGTEHFPYRFLNSPSINLYRFYNY